MIPRLIELVESFGGQRILLAGDLILDRYVYGDAERISPEAPVPVLRRRHVEERVGGAGSVAAHLREWGIEVTCCGVLGTDDAGCRVRALLQAQGIETHAIHALTGRPTTTKTRYIGLAQHRHRQQLMRVDEELTTPLSPADADRLGRVAVEAVLNADVVCIEDYDKGLLTTAFCRRLIDAARKAGRPVLVDPARLDSYERYRGATLLTPNRSEFQYVAGIDYLDVDRLEAQAHALVERFDLEGLLVTLDRDGCLLATKGDEPHRFATRPRAVYDNTGAGDAVLAMLAAARSAGASWEEAARLTNVAGGLEVEKFGCIPLSRGEIVADLRIASGASAGKIRRPDDLVAELALRRSRGETVVFTNGCFDILHAGHVRFLEACREHGHVLVLGVNSDASVRAQNKAADRPIIPQDQRVQVLAALQMVDYVVTFDEPTPEAIIEKLTPDVLVKGEDWRQRGVVGREHVEGAGGRVVLLPLLDGVSTTRIIERIRG